MDETLECVQEISCDRSNFSEFGFLHLNRYQRLPMGKPTRRIENLKLECPWIKEPTDSLSASA